MYPSSHLHPPHAVTLHTYFKFSIYPDMAPWEGCITNFAAIHQRNIQIKSSLGLAVTISSAFEMTLTKSTRPIAASRARLRIGAVTLLAVELDREGVFEASERDADLSPLDRTDALLEGDLRLVPDHRFVPHT